MIHPYYKLDWVENNWGGAEEQAEEIVAGDPFAQDWKAEVRQLVSDTVSLSCTSQIEHHELTIRQVQKYWPDRLVFPDGLEPMLTDTDVLEKMTDDKQYTAKTLPSQAAPTASAPTNDDDATTSKLLLREFDRKRAERLAAQEAVKAEKTGFTDWEAEKVAWLKSVEKGVGVDTDVCDWWSVSGAYFPSQQVLTPFQGECDPLSHHRPHRVGLPSRPSLVCRRRIPLLQQLANRRCSPHSPGFGSLRGAADSEGAVEEERARLRRLQLRPRQPHRYYAI